MFNTNIFRLVKLSLISICLMGSNTTAVAAETLPARGYHLGEFENGPGGKPVKPAMLFRHLLFNFQNPGFHSADTFVDTAADQIVALKLAAVKFPDTATQQAAAAEAKIETVAALNNYFEAQGPDGATPAQKLSGLYGKLYQTFNQAFAPQVGQPIPLYKDGQLVAFLNKATGDKIAPGSPSILLATQAFTSSQRLFRMMLLISRGFNNDFFAELRKNEPIFMIPGDEDASASAEDQAKLAAQKAAGSSIRVEKASYLVTRYKDIAYGYGYDLKDPSKSGYGDNWSPVAVERQSPPFTNVIYSRPVAYFGEQMARFAGAALNLMDYVVGGYFKYVVNNVMGQNSWPVDVNGKFMLGTKNEIANAEKAYLHKITNRIQKINSEEGELDNRAESMEKVREVVAWYVKDAMKNKASDTQVDFARDISRQAALGMVTDYFGFYPPDVNSQTQWSRNTQNSFFHNIFDLAWYDHMALKTGDEMAAYIHNVLSPSYNAQLENGRPSTDTISMMISGHAKIPSAVKAAFNINDGRIMATTMGLLVGAGETTTMAVNFALHEIMVRAAIAAKEGNYDLWTDFVTTAKKAAAGDKAARDRFDAYIWEALRFKPVNPWTERVSDKEETLNTCTQPKIAIVQGKPQQVASSCSDVTIANNARVLFVTQSAMFDPDMKLIGGSSEKDPWKFSVERGNDNYIHFAFGYHRCLGDDVAQAMTPEIALQVVANVNGIKLAETLASVNNPENDNVNPADRELMFTKQTVPVNPHFRAAVKAKKGIDLPAELTGESTPFPETFTIVYESKEANITRDQAPLDKAFSYLADELAGTDTYGDQVKAALEYVAFTEATNADGASDRVLNNGLNRFDIAKFQAHQENLLELEENLRQSNYQPWRTCMKWQTDDYGGEADARPKDGKSLTRIEICNQKTRFKRFNTCYMIQRTLGQLSTKHAFNKCAYEKDSKGLFRFSGTSKFEDGQDALNEYLRIVNGKGDMYWVKYRETVSN